MTRIEYVFNCQHLFPTCNVVQNLLDRGARCARYRRRQEQERQEQEKQARITRKEKQDKNNKKRKDKQARITRQNKTKPTTRRWWLFSSQSSPDFSRRQQSIKYFKQFFIHIISGEAHCFQLHPLRLQFVLHHLFFRFCCPLQTA